MPIVTVEVDVELHDFDTKDLERELESRGSKSLQNGFDPMEGKNSAQLLEAVFESRRRRDDPHALELIDRLIYATLGRIV